MDERHFRRVPFEAEVQVAVGDHGWTCTLVDLALKGALLESATTLPLARGTVASLSLPLPGSPVVLDFEAELVHREGQRLGFKFLREDLETFSHLRTLLELNTGDPEGVRSELLDWLRS
ncbi:MAG: PilZ domain-containing protein [Deltaproteobacteria bacterium]|nr:MAG: PilZ domain-containing protein [Deltaproteobacteria bacterium]